MNAFSHPAISAHLNELRRMIALLADTGAISLDAMVLMVVAPGNADVAIIGCDCPKCRERYVAALNSIPDRDQPRRAPH